MGNVIYVDFKSKNTVTVETVVEPTPEPTPVEQPKKSRKTKKVIEYRDVGRYDGQNADVIPGESIRLFGTDTNRYTNELDENGRRKTGVTFDTTFKVGDTAIYGSYNLIYTGTIVSIGPKTVTIQEDHGTRRHRLPIHRFLDRNAHYDAEYIAKHNSEMLWTI